MLQLPPPSKGQTIQEQHHILQLNFRHVQAELQRKTMATEGLLAQRDSMRAQLELQLPAHQEQQRKLRVELNQHKQAAHAQVRKMREQMLHHVEQFERLRGGTASVGSDEQRATQSVVQLAVQSRVAAAVKAGALRGRHRHTLITLSHVECERDELRTQLCASEIALHETSARAAEHMSALEAEQCEGARLATEAMEAARASGLAEERCRELASALEGARGREAAERERRVEEVRRATDELAERTLTIVTLEAKLAETEQAAATARAAATSSEEESRNEMDSLRRQLEETSAEVAAQRAAKEELLGTHERMARELRAAVQAANEASENAQRERQAAREQMDGAMERERSLAGQLAREERARKDCDEQLQEVCAQRAWAHTPLYAPALYPPYSPSLPCGDNLVPSSGPGCLHALPIAVTCVCFVRCGVRCPVAMQSASCTRHATPPPQRAPMRQPCRCRRASWQWRARQQCSAQPRRCSSWMQSVPRVQHSRPRALLHRMQSSRRIVALCRRSIQRASALQANGMTTW